MVCMQAVVYLHLSWKDPRAKAALDKYSAAQNSPGAYMDLLHVALVCNVLCVELMLPGPHTYTPAEYNGGNGCMRFCDHPLDAPWGRLSGPAFTSTRRVQSTHRVAVGTPVLMCLQLRVH